MKLKVYVIDFEVPPKVKKWVARMGIPVAVILGGGAIAWAGGMHVWAQGDVLNATDLNGNFTALDTRVSALEAQKATETRDGGYSLGAIYCGATGATTGDLSGLAASGIGYAKAKNACQTACSAPSAHMCTADELVRSNALSVGPSVMGWYSTGVSTLGFTTANQYVLDCVSWKNGSGSDAGLNGRQGASWANYGATVSDCNALQPALCCE